ncbi:MAG TPA: C2 family cysteine protease [Polyangiaceae bacterium]|jgi:hypothetical protein|nr:C2 family cysteine protease [Polyangiaceae bacterium]
MQTTFQTHNSIGTVAAAARHPDVRPPTLPEFLQRRADNVGQMPRLNGAFGNDSTSQPNPTLGSTKVHYAKVEGELFGDKGPKLGNIDQGNLGDCFFLASVGAVVADDPTAIRNAIRDNADGTYSVRFYHDTLFGHEPVWITVNGELPVDSNGRLAYAQGVDSDADGKLELWVPIMEKAYAKYVDKYGADDGKSGYADIGAGGSSRAAIEALTGRSAHFDTLPSGDAKLESMLSAANDGRQVVVSTKDKGADGWVGHHAYTVVGTYEKDGETMVMLRNPWGSTEPDAADKGKKANDGLFSVSLDELRKHVRGVSSNEPASSFIDLLRSLF